MRKFSGPSADYGTKSSRIITHLGKVALLITRHDGSQYAQPVFQGSTRLDPFARAYFIRIAPRFAQAVKRAARSSRTAPRRTRRTVRSSAKSGDSNDDADPDPEPERRPNSLLDQASLASYLCISKHTVQNLYSKTPHLLPPAIHIPGARGPRWTPESVQEWLSGRPRHTPPAPVVVAPKRKAGRPRIAALRGNGGVS